MAYKFKSKSINPTKGFVITVTLSIVFWLFLGLISIHNTWFSNKNTAEQKGLTLAKSFAASLDFDLIKKLDASPNDINKIEYINIKESLMSIKNINNDFRFLYFYTLKNNKIYFMVDSEPQTSKDYSPPGQLYYEATKNYYNVFYENTSKIFESNDRWGKWISVVVPITDKSTGKVIACFGVDFPQKNFYSTSVSHTLQQTFLVFFGLILIIVFFTILHKNKTLVEANKRTTSAKENLNLLISQMQQGFALHEIITDDKNKPIDYRFVRVNQSFENITGLNSTDIIGKTVLELMPKTEKYWIETYGKVALTGEPCHIEDFSLSLDKHFDVWAYSPKNGQFAVIFIDITSKVNQQKRISYMYYHDSLTSLLNRDFVKNNLEQIDCESNFPLSVVFADINGLKLTNEAFGRDVGDYLIKQFSIIVNTNVRESDIVARWDGDTIIIFMPNTDSDTANKIVEKIRLECQENSQSNLSVSFGYATKENVDDDIEKVISSAENMMTMNKTYESPSFRGKTIQIIMNTLHEKNQREEEHSIRVSQNCEKIGSALGLPYTDIKILRTIGLLHDIGKIGINENILNKPDKLTTDEWIELKKHTEIGYRILSSTNETSQIADYILSHHERYDGKGYPEGLSGENIPLLTRILSIADAYDAMTSTRTYKDVFLKQQAIDELYRCSNAQFDAEIVDVFVKKVLLEE